jgi:hypothetical protein
VTLGEWIRDSVWPATEGSKPQRGSSTLWKLCGLGSIVLSAVALSSVWTFFRSGRLTPIAGNKAASSLDVVSLQIDLLSIMLTVAGIVLAIVGVFGYQTIKEEAVKAAEKVAAQTAQEVARAYDVPSRPGNGNGDLSQFLVYGANEQPVVHVAVAEVDTAKATPVTEEDEKNGRD